MDSSARKKHKFNRIRQVVPMCPNGRAHWRHLANTIELALPLAHPSPQTKREISVQPLLHSLWQKVPILNNGRPFLPKLPLLTGGSGPHLIHGSLGQSEPTNQIYLISLATQVVLRCIMLCSKFSKNRLSAGLQMDMLGELTALPRFPR